MNINELKSVKGVCFCTGDRGSSFTLVKHPPPTCQRNSTLWKDKIEVASEALLVLRGLWRRSLRCQNTEQTPGSVSIVPLSVVEQSRSMILRRVFTSRRASHLHMMLTAAWENDGVLM